MWQVTTFRRLWDCNIEKHASDNMCGAALAQNYYAITETLAQGDPIYVKADSLDKVCSNCEPKLPVDPCINQLCQQEYTSPGDIPERACTAQDDMSNDLQTIATDMHNYYRRLVATGWGLDKDGYAPPAKSMLALKYVCDDASNNNIATATKTLVDTCPDTPPPATAGHTLNHFYMNTLKDSREVFLQKAIENWANEAAKVGVGKDNIFHENAGFNNYGHVSLKMSQMLSYLM
ncbi:hypothetical protein ANCCEY_03068 [Ancylostoma ceylanicum]|uniref:SCP domain-containing protein n=1 Tax=Ancylostoma ceylanicum TaxID=53326 RepID=A0A0D6M0L1_9BILA|nr:hypothetical protein ANCCEY_03068 [Ancylostoma ceylanicum]